MYEEGGRYYQTARAFFGQLAEAEPENAELQFDLFHCWLGEFHVRGSLDPVIDSLPLLQQAHDRIAWLRQQFPEDVRYGDAYVNTLPLVAWRLENDSERKLELLLHAHAEAMLLRSKLPEPCLEWRHAGLTASHVAHQLTEGGRLSEAANWLDKALDLQTEYLELASKDLLEELDCLGMKFQQGQLLVKLGESERGTQLQSEVLERSAVLVKEYPDYYNFQQALEGWSREFQEQSAERLLPASGS